MALISSKHTMKAYELILSEQLKYEEGVGPVLAYKDQRIGLITDNYSKVEDFFNKPKTAIIDGIPLESTGSWTGPTIIQEDGKRKLSYTCRSVNPWRFHNPIMTLRQWDNVIIPQTFQWIGRDIDILKQTKFVGLDIQLQGDITEMIQMKPCSICPIKYISMEQFRGEDLKTKSFDQPGKENNIDQLEIDGKKFWAINVFLSQCVIKILKRRKEYRILSPPLSIIQKISEYVMKSFIGSIDYDTFQNLCLPKGPDGLYNLDLWPSPEDTDFVQFLTNFLPQIQTDEKLLFLTNHNTLLQLT